MPELTEAQRATLRAVCDTYVPSLPRADDADGFWGRAASHLGVDQGLADVLAGLPADQSAGMAQLLDVLAEQGFLGASQASREQLLRNTAMASREAAGGIAALRGLTFLLTYAGVDPATGRNPNWERLGYPGPPQVDPARSSPSSPWRSTAT
jgi:hypothetical protein